jgi:large subunit ribosomal protein L29
MAIIKKKDLKNLSPDDLKNRLNELKKEMVKYNAQIAIGTIPKSPGQVRQTKKTIAKIETELKERETKKK